VTGGSGLGVDAAPPTAKGAVRRAAIVEAAVDVLVDEGLAATTHRAVAARAGVPLGSTTYYFADRVELVQAALEGLADREHVRMAAVASRPWPRGRRSRGELAARLVDVVVGRDRLARPAEVAASYERFLEAARTPALAGPARRWQRDTERSVGELLAGTSRAALDPPTVLALVDGAVVAWLVGEDPGPADLAAAVEAHLGALDALGSRRGG
jgi:DNA-binding transcriptional regulator YbjK